MDELATKLVEWMSAFEAAVVEVAPQAAELALAYARVDAAGNLLVGVALAVVSCVLLTKATKLYRSGVEESKNSSHGAAGDIFLIGSLLGGPGAVLGSMAAVNVLNIWNWVGLFYPELYLVRMALG